MCIDSYADISIHTPTRGTTAGTGTATNLAEFQSTFPREERPYYTIVRIQVLQFQSTLPREERPFPTDFVTAFMPYFNPRSHERSDNYIPDEFKSYIISIHAPTRGATMTSDETGMVAIFQSTLPREERPVRRYSLPLISVNFNPRSHERSDNIQNLTFALTKRFQSTLPREERLSFPCNISFHLIFQSTLPREERQTMRKLTIAELNFNPRSHERSDQCFYIAVL